MLDKDTLLDALLVLYNESSSEKMMKDKNIATFVKKCELKLYYLQILIVVFDVTEQSVQPLRMS